MSNEHKPTTAIAVQVKNQWKPISTEEKLNVISLLEKDGWIIDVCPEVKSCL